ncbi:peptidylprolyl isomerase [Histidinibacterium aquaticum]|uniref:Peptidyl-prolyl cis-trans isomerase n=1 Tax=Histidinibacterium aquaticum TaxID=2613962 RepID=A0A5J5GPY4_9RHOB|nr:peptidylprolyl isomerase [Histidinibacterium aquaticum]
MPERFTVANAPEAPNLEAGDCALEEALDTAQGAESTAAGEPGPWLALCIAGQAQGDVVIDLNEQAAPQHTERLVTLAEQGAYDQVVFHRVIEGFMAQTGDVEFGKAGSDLGRAGGGGSEMPDLEAEFSDIPFERGVVGMARTQDPDSANSQFFIMFDSASHLDGSYTVVGEVVAGMEVVDQIRRGRGSSGAVTENPDAIVEARVRQ